MHTPFLPMACRRSLKGPSMRILGSQSQLAEVCIYLKGLHENVTFVDSPQYAHHAPGITLWPTMDSSIGMGGTSPKQQYSKASLTLSASTSASLARAPIALSLCAQCSRPPHVTASTLISLVHHTQSSMMLHLRETMPKWHSM